MKELIIRLFGNVEMYNTKNKKVYFRHKESEALLIYLFLEKGKHPRARLNDLLFVESRNRRRLSNALSVGSTDLSACGLEGVLMSDLQDIWFNESTLFRCDLIEFEEFTRVISEPEYHLNQAGVQSDLLSLQKAVDKIYLGSLFEGWAPNKGVWRASKTGG